MKAEKEQGNETAGGQNPTAPSGGRDAADFPVKSERARFPIKAVAAIAVLLVGAAIFTVFMLLEPGGQVEPELPESSATIPAQSPVQVDLTNGNQALALSLPYDALFYFSRAWELEPDDPAVQEGLASVVDSVLNKNYEGSQLQRIERQYEDVENLLSFPSLSTNSELLNLRETLQSQLDNQ